MQIKSVAETDLMSLVNRYAHTEPAARARMEGTIIALVDAHVREQLMEIETRRRGAMLNERRNRPEAVKH